MPARRSWATDLVKKRTIQALLPEMVIRAGTPVIREGEPVILCSLDRDLVPIRDLYPHLQQKPFRRVLEDDRSLFGMWTDGTYCTGLPEEAEH